MNSQLKINEDNLPEGLWQEVLKVCQLIKQAGGRAWLVGGCVRDSVLQLPIRDVDLEVFQLEDDQLRTALQTQYKLNFVGQSFGIYKLSSLPIDVGLPRRESKSGRGHKSFEVVADPGLSLAEAAARRDFTINSIYLDPLTEEIQDPYNGMVDLKNSILRHTSEAFGEDPLRVLRGVQLAARFNLIVAPETVATSQTMGMEGLAPERIFWEWEKLILRGIKPSMGLKFLKDSGWISYFPELQDLPGVPQDPRWHPEGDVWVHTLHCMDVFAENRLGDEYEDLVVGLAVLCHDIGKPATTVVLKDKIQSLGHAKKGGPLTRHFLGRMTNQEKLVRHVVTLVENHMAPVIFYRDQVSDAAIRRLSTRVGRIDRLVRVAQADVMGRPPLPLDPFPAGPWLLAQAWRLQVCENPPAAIIQGRHLIDLGFFPGLHFKEILDSCFEAQLAGEIATESEGRVFVLNEFGVPKPE